ncbi:hypothetical protein BGZ70_003790 [Mortierella alpina]|uniref:Nicotinamide N-methyltransferase n=1 Tax=Mortierella alpina TaxID=64518 RepID=A0A9P6LVX6_MORAP|nr:hypothetical protein BGZ70_003790 [Mortierella alpina]
MAAANKKSAYNRTPEQQQLDQQKRLERMQKRASSSPSSPNSNSSKTERDFLDGFEQSIGLFGDASVANGEAGQIFDYKQGLLQLHLANVGGGVVKLMSHYVWNAALIMAEYIEQGELINVQGKRVIEFGAGAALPGLLCVKRGARFATLTDYPDQAIVKNLERNWYENLIESTEEKEARRIAGQESTETLRYKKLLEGQDHEPQEDRRSAEQRVRCAVRGHAWGESVQDLMDCLPVDGSDGEERGYDWVLLADTLWVSEGHAGLLKSCLSVLKRNNEGTQANAEGDAGRILVCCGLHSGYNTVQRFMALAQSSEYGLRSELIEVRRLPVWGDDRTPEELRRESELLEEKHLEQFSVEDRNRTVLVYILSQKN